MPRLTSRDYKKSRRAGLDLGRYRQFLYGAGVGVVLASAAFLYAGARAHPAGPAQAAQPPHAAVLAAADGGASAATGAETFSYPDMLAKSQVALPPANPHAKHTLPASHRAQDSAH
jgi:hypothetical protein